MSSTKIIYSLTKNKLLVREVSKLSNIPLGKAECWHFKDGEFMGRSNDEVEGKDVYVLQSTSRPAGENIMQLLIFIDGLKRSNASSITVIIPYFGYSRQDRILHKNDPISSALVASLLESAGANKVIYIDIHTEKISEYFHIPTYNLYSTPIFKDYYLDFFSKEKIDMIDVVVFSPDHGNESRGKRLASSLSCAFGEIQKCRPSRDHTKIVSVKGDVKDKYVIICDDIIDTGSTMLEAIYEAKRLGAKKIFISATHAVFSKESEKNLLNSPIDDFVISNTIDKKLDKRIKIISCAPLIAKLLK